MQLTGAYNRGSLLQMDKYSEGAKSRLQLEYCLHYHCFGIPAYTIPCYLLISTLPSHLHS